jgi:hypothetical protein
MSSCSHGRRAGDFQQPPAGVLAPSCVGHTSRQSYVPTTQNDAGRRWSCWIFSHRITAFAAQGSTSSMYDGLRVFAGPFESEATAIAWIIQRQEAMNQRRPERASAIH